METRKITLTFSFTPVELLALLDEVKGKVAEGLDIVQYANDIINGKVPAYLPETEVSSDE